MAGWQRLCTVYKKDLAPYLDRILPDLFKIVEKVINDELKAVNDPLSLEIPEEPKSEK